VNFVPGSGQALRERGRLRTAFLPAAVLALAAAAAMVLSASSRAAGSPAIGIDMTPNEANTNSVNEINPCTDVRPGDEFAADLFVTNVDSLTAWELRVEFDPAVVSLESADYNFLLVKTGGQIVASEFQQEKPGRIFLAAAQPHSPNSGSGVLARLHLKALANGASSLTVMSSPTYFSPRLTGAGGLPTGDTTGDGYFDGPITGGTVNVGRSCPATTPVVTSPPAGAVTPAPGKASPALAGGAATGATDSGSGPSTAGNGSSSDSGPAPSTAGNGSSSDSGPLVIEASPGTSPASDGNNRAASSPGAGSSGGQGSSQQPVTLGDTANSAAQGSGGSAASTVLAVSGVAAALAIILGAALLFLRRRGRTGIQ
jgi:Cohesin domain